MGVVLQKLTFDRVEYSPNENELTILMSTDIHDGLGAEIVQSISDKFVLIRQGQNCDNSQLIDAAGKIKSHGTSKLAFDGTRTRRAADGSFTHRGCTKQKVPTWVIEVNWTRSKTREDFAERAKELIRLSKGEIRTVVNVDLGEIYRAGQKNGVKTGGPAPALLSIWRPRIETSASGGESDLTAYADPEEVVCSVPVPRSGTDGFRVVITCARFSVMPAERKPSRPRCDSPWRISFAETVRPPFQVPRIQ